MSPVIVKNEVKFVDDDPVSEGGTVVFPVIVALAPLDTVGVPKVNCEVAGIPANVSLIWVAPVSGDAPLCSF